MDKKALAVQCLEQLDIYSPYIRRFKSKAGTPCFFENYAGFWADQEPELWNKIREVETEYGVLVYALTHELTELGETWSMLCSSDDLNLSELLSSKSDTQFYAHAYVWNKTNPMFSEFGDIVIKAAYGGIKRLY